MNKKNNENTNKEDRDEKVTNSQKGINPLQINVPDNLPAIYSDSAFVNNNKYGVTINFAQTFGPTNRQNVIARIGMSKEHAKALIKVLEKNLDENEEGR